MLNRTIGTFLLLAIASVSQAAEDLQQCVLDWHASMQGEWRASNHFFSTQNGELDGNVVRYTRKQKSEGVFGIELKVEGTDQQAAYTQDVRFGGKSTAEPWVKEDHVVYRVEHCSRTADGFEVVQQYSNTGSFTGVIMDFKEHHVSGKNSLYWVASRRPASTDRPFMPFITHVSKRIE
ncbi:MAG: hypothetical protein AAF529_01730 [Pseudomonadota bacterium]